MTPPRTHLVQRSTREIYSSRANRIVIRHHLGKILAVLGIVSPGNKDSKAAIRDFVEKTIEYLKGGVRVLIVDLFSSFTARSARPAQADLGRDRRGGVRVSAR